MAIVRKFLFETDFDDPASGADAAVPSDGEASPPPPPPTFSEEEMAAAKAEAHQAGLTEGMARGRAEAEAKIEKSIATALAAIETQLRAISERLVLGRAAIAGSAVELAMAMVRKLYPALDQRGDLAEIEAVVTRALVDMRQEPKLTVQVPTALLGELQSRVPTVAGASGFEGKLSVIGGETLGGSDCRVSWANGGIERHAPIIWCEINAALERCLARNGITVAAGDLSESASDETSNAASAAG